MIRLDVLLSIFIRLHRAQNPPLASLTWISSDFLLTDLQLSGAWTVLSLEFSHDMAAEGGAGGKRTVKTEDAGKRVYCCFVNTVSLRVFLVWQIAVVTRQEKKRLGGFRDSVEAWCWTRKLRQSTQQTAKAWWLCLHVMHILTQSNDQLVT